MIAIKRGHESDPKNARDTHFVKYQSNGNDFIIIEVAEIGNLSLKQAEALAKLCDRHVGIGADGIILLAEADSLQIAVINADGSLAKNCGNGLRCAAAYLFAQRPDLVEVDIDFDHHRYRCYQQSEYIAVTMGPCQVKRQADFYFASNDVKAFVGLATIKNEHLLFYLERSVERFDDMLLEIEQQKNFPASINIGFIFEDELGRYRSRVHERGVGWTQACGSGAVAAASFIQLLHGEPCPKELSLWQPGGEIVVNISSKSIGFGEAVISSIQSARAYEVFTGICQAIWT